MLKSQLSRQSSSEICEDYSVSKGDEINDFTDDSNVYQSTNISGVPSPILSDKHLAE